jgi:hydrogenase nickel incorporation protein HypA/HybF
MHEYSIASALLDRILLEAEERRALSVASVDVRIGALAGIELSALAAAWELVREGTKAEGAPLRIVEVEAAWRCPACGIGIPRGERLRCGRCGGAARLDNGDEVLLERIELEVA